MEIRQDRSSLGEEDSASPGAPSPGLRHSALGDLVAGEIRRAILAGRYKPGERLVEDRLARDFSVSRIPVREALRSLASEGLVVMAPRRGATVTTISREAAQEMIEVRATLEGLNARLAARRRDPPLLAAIDEVLKQGNAAAKAGRVEALVELNAQFHDLLARAGSNTVLGDILRSLRDRTSTVFKPNPERARRDWEEHARILEAVVGGDEDLAALLAARHVAGAGDDYLARECREAVRKAS